jgi:hypothetical protein
MPDANEHRVASAAPTLLGSAMVLVAALAGALVLTAGPARAEDAGAAERTRAWAATVRMREATMSAAREPLASARRHAASYDARARTAGFYHAHLLPRLNGQFETLAVFRAVPGAGSELAEFPLLDMMTDAARRRAERGTKKALKEFLVQATSLGRVAERVDGVLEREHTESGKRTRLSADIAHGKPRLDLRRRFAAGSLRIGLDVSGSLGLEYRRTGSSRMRIFAEYDAADGEFDAACRFSF